jgi:hypothetical protein
MAGGSTDIYLALFFHASGGMFYYAKRGLGGTGAENFSGISGRRFISIGVLLYM